MAWRPPDHGKGQHIFKMTRSSDDRGSRIHTSNSRAKRILARDAQLLVCRGSIDEVTGIVRKQDLIDQVLDGRSPDVEQVTRPPLIVHELTSILRTLDLFRKTPVHTAIVVDEFGALQGIVTRTDLLEAVAGDLPKIDAPARPKITQREDGSYLVDASVPFPDVMQLIGIGGARRRLRDPGRFRPPAVA